MSMIALSHSLKLLIFKSLILNMVLILKLLLISVEPLLLILKFLKKIGTCIMNLLKTPVGGMTPGQGQDEGVTWLITLIRV